MNILRPLFIIFILSIQTFTVVAKNKDVDVSSVIQLEREDNLLTVKESQISLENILTEIATQTEIKFVFLVSLEEPFQTSFSRLPLEKGLKQLLHGYNYSIILGAEKTGEGEEEIRKVIVLSREGESYRGNAGTNIASPGDQEFEGSEMENDPMNEEMLRQMEGEEMAGERQIDDENETSGGSQIEEFQEGNKLGDAPGEIETEIDSATEEMLREIEREEMERGGEIDDEGGV
ncbi:MAG: hypothetical protein D8M57_04415 [Candidatus Scalindua sp. AMX11]|nr:MAG: hypothetical protein DWQ00_04180 [Candidatus Scalindua sp.]NOG84640.1 hypothetical protein [Planctomycetota bacterium]RZV92413.1 MAG: hypothetical protein EX341_05025 [Candidatus Scalindua sp. SCAELEC01]TDE66060.1 MAG: hypothetical protein D8M57_04415 [Candidatus Scalindua sp. AMX11]GJQ59033.1 MAG: hypothetical protein SCALA701_18340 [Candidatus Scalindua sp.]